MTQSLLLVELNPEDLCWNFVYKILIILLLPHSPESIGVIVINYKRCENRIIQWVWYCIYFVIWKWLLYSVSNIKFCTFMLLSSETAYSLMSISYALNMPVLIHLFLRKVKKVSKSAIVWVLISQFCKENVSLGLSFYMHNAKICRNYVLLEDFHFAYLDTNKVRMQTFSSWAS
jgi:hypothetical protein